MSHARLHMVRGSAAADKTCEKAEVSRWFTQFGAKSGTAAEVSGLSGAFQDGSYEKSMNYNG